MRTLERTPSELLVNFDILVVLSSLQSIRITKPFSTGLNWLLRTPCQNSGRTWKIAYKQARLLKFGNIEDTWILSRYGSIFRRVGRICTAQIRSPPLKDWAKTCKAVPRRAILGSFNKSKWYDPFDPFSASDMFSEFGCFSCSLTSSTPSCKCGVN